MNDSLETKKEETVENQNINEDATLNTGEQETVAGGAKKDELQQPAEDWCICNNLHL